MLEALREFFSTQSFMPHGHCYLWQPGLVFLQVTTNFLIGMAYVSIALTLAYLVRKVEDIPFKWVYICFGIFIITCGFTHLFNIYVIWNPAYWWDAGVRTITALASVGTAILLFPLVPKALAVAKGAKEAHKRGVELETLVEDLGTMYEKTRELEELKSRFFANMSHELRTPLALIIAPTEKLLQSDNITDEQRRDAEVVLRNAHTVLRHVNDLLDVATTEAGEMKAEFERINATDLLQRVAAHFEALAEDRQINFVVEAADEVWADIDPGKVERILLNLLSNAFKYTPDGGEIIISLSTTPLEGERTQEKSDREGGGRRNRMPRKGAKGEELIIEVGDSGPGIVLKDRHIVFERFHQLEGGSTRRFGGTGLGLFIVREFVELLDGKVVIGDAPQGGALFRIEIPRNAPADVEVKQEGALADRTSSLAQYMVEELQEADREKKPLSVESALRADEEEREDVAEFPLVLVVEDNRDMRRYVAETLAEKFRILTAADGREGLAMALSERPDLIISDVMMPEMSGDEMVSEIGSHEELEHIPIVMLTAKADEELRLKLLRKGAVDYVMKPFSAPELVARVSNLVEMKRARDVLRRELESKSWDVEELAQELVRRRRQVEGALQAAQVAREQAEKASQIKSNFVGMVSHELRTPIAALQLYIDLLGAYESRLEKEQAEIVGRMSGVITRLTDIVEALLQQAVIESGRLTVDKESLEPGQVVQEALEPYLARAEDKGLEFIVEIEPDLPTLRSDERLLRLAVGNLVANAVKFTAEGHIRVEVSSDDDARCRITVSDTGPGIPEEARENIFRPFEQLEEIKHKHTPGVGLGLALTNELITAMEARIELETEVGKGSRFSIVFPGANK